MKPIIYYTDGSVSSNATDLAGFVKITNNLPSLVTEVCDSGLTKHESASTERYAIQMALNDLHSQGDQHQGVIYTDQESIVSHPNTYFSTDDLRNVNFRYVKSTHTQHNKSLNRQYASMIHSALSLMGDREESSRTLNPLEISEHFDDEIRLYIDNREGYKRYRGVLQQLVDGEVVCETGFTIHTKRSIASQAKRDRDLLNKLCKWSSDIGVSPQQVSLYISRKFKDTLVDSTGLKTIERDTSIDRMHLYNQEKKKFDNITNIVLTSGRTMYQVNIDNGRLNAKRVRCEIVSIRGNRIINSQGVTIDVPVSENALLKERRYYNDYIVNELMQLFKKHNIHLNDIAFVANQPLAVKETADTLRQLYNVSRNVNVRFKALNKFKHSLDELTLSQRAFVLQQQVDNQTNQIIPVSIRKPVLTPRVAGYLVTSNTRAVHKHSVGLSLVDNGTKVCEQINVLNKKNGGKALVKNALLTIDKQMEEYHPTEPFIIYVSPQINNLVYGVGKNSVYHQVWQSLRSQGVQFVCGDYTKENSLGLNLNDKQPYDFYREVRRLKNSYREGEGNFNANKAVIVEQLNLLDDSMD